MIRFAMPKLRIYQQILICFGLIVTIPLVGVSFIINTVNQHALKKELGRFTEHTAESIFRDFGTEMNWQKQQSRMMAKLLTGDLRQGKSFEASARQILELGKDMDGVGIYDAQGHLIQAAYKNFEQLSPELRLPDDLPHEQTGDEPGKLAVHPFQVIYFNNGNPQDSPYSLRAAIPLESNKLNAAYFVQQQDFSYLQNMVRTNNSLYDAFYIIDSDGYIIAGPSVADMRERISPEDYAQFAKARPGVTHEFETTAQTVNEKNRPNPDKQNDGEEDPPLKKVVVKMPDINWGIIIESPYHMKQKYVKRAGIQTILLIVGCLVLILLLVLPYILGISRNFRQLIKGVKAMGEGNYFRRIRLISNFFTPYEIVYLTLEFNRMARKTADSWQAIQDANRKLAAMDEFKSNLIDTVSHELRTPLTSIKGYTSRLLRYDETLDSETRIKSLKVVKQQADRLSRLVDDLLVIPDLENEGGLRVYPDQVDLANLLDNSVQFIQAKDQREIIVRFDHHLHNDLSVLADPDRLEQILVNLLDNAVKYSLPDTPIRVQVEPEQPEDPESRIAISVTNVCDPIPMQKLDELDSLFEKFKRLDDSLIRTTRGSGLGLFITRGLVEAMGGEIRLEYEEDRFTVRFSVPQYKASEETAADEAMTV